MGLIFVGVAIMLQSLLGCTGTLMGCCGDRQNARTCLFTYGALVAAVVVLEVLAAVLVLNVYRGYVEEEVEAFMNNTIVTKYKPTEAGEPNSVSLLWDHIMTSMECCGVSGYQDFTGKVPLACCTSAPEGKCPEVGSPPLHQMDTGCLPLLLAGTIPALVSSLILVTIFQVGGLSLTGRLGGR